MRYVFFLCIGMIFVGCALPGDPEPPVVPYTSEALPVESAVLPAPVERVEVLVHQDEKNTCSYQVARALTKVRPVIAPAIQAEHQYAWEQGKVFTISLSPQQATGIFFPQGEHITQGFYLSEEDYEVHTPEKVTHTTGVTIRPKFEKGEHLTFVATDAGRRYLLRLVVGKKEKAMLVVTFTAPPLDGPVPTPIAQQGGFR